MRLVEILRAMHDLCKTIEDSLYYDYGGHVKKEDLDELLSYVNELSDDYSTVMDSDFLLNVSNLIDYDSNISEFARFDGHDYVSQELETTIESTGKTACDYAAEHNKEYEDIPSYPFNSQNTFLPLVRYPIDH